MNGEMHAQRRMAAGSPDELREIERALGEYRSLSVQLRQMAAGAEPSALQAVLIRRAGVLAAIRSRRAPAASAPAPHESEADFTRSLAEIAEMDRDVIRLLEIRSAGVAAEIAKLRAGKQWRMTCES